MKMTFLAIAAVALGVLADKEVKADELMQPLAQSGDWMAASHRPTMLAAPDVCFAGNMASKFLLRADQTSTEIRIADDSWSLPPSVSGAIEVKIGAYTASFDIDSNTNNMVMATIKPGSAVELFAAMDEASSMSVTVGKSTRTVSLSGSTKVTNAFRTCAGIKGAPADPSSNPFQ